MRAFTPFFSATLLAVLLLPALALADPVPPPPARCPRGYTPRTWHGGPYCAPPPPRNCPPGHLPRVHIENAYCEPPPPQPCPVGSFWTSTSPTDGYCQGGPRCDQGTCYQEGYTCRDSSLCVEVGRVRRFAYEKVSRACTSDVDCRGVGSCVTAKRCDPDVRRAPATSSAPRGQTDDVERAGCAVTTEPARSKAWVAFLLVPAIIFLVNQRRCSRRRSV